MKPATTHWPIAYSMALKDFKMARRIVMLGAANADKLHNSEAHQAALMAVAALDDAIKALEDG